MVATHHVLRRLCIGGDGYHSLACGVAKCRLQNCHIDPENVIIAMALICFHVHFSEYTSEINTFLSSKMKNTIYAHVIVNLFLHPAP